jgi:thiol-disulfide isomerase/thioredoxin
MRARIEPEVPGRRSLLATFGMLMTVRAGAASGEAAVPGERVEWPALTLIDGSVLGPGAWHDTAAVVVFWATWCGFCRRHNAHIDQLHRAAAGEHLRVLGVAVDGDEPAVRRYMQSYGYTFPVVARQAALRERFTARRVVPMTCLVDRSGLLRLVIPGEMAPAEVQALAALAHSPVRQ